MILNRSLLADADIGFQTRFNLVIEKMRGATMWQQFAMEIPSTHRIEQYAWVTAIPTMKEWVSDAVFAELEAYSFTLANKFWQMGLQVKREDLEDDRLGIVRPALDMLGENAARHPDKLIFQLMAAGFAGTLGLAYDGQYFFDTDHKDGNGATQSNKGTDDLDGDAFDDAVLDMESLVDEAGEPLDISPTHLVIGPELRAVARALFLMPTLSGGAANPYYQAVKVVVVPRLRTASADKPWFLFDLSKSLRPFIFQVMEQLKFAAQVQPEAENNFMRRIYRWSCWARYNAGYAMWQTSWGSDGTGS